MSLRSLYDITSGSGFGKPQSGEPGLRSHCASASSYELMKPSIFPPSMSLPAGPAPCGPPFETSDGSCHGYTHSAVVGSFTQTVGFPALSTGMPSAPGYMPKYESKEWFSCMKMMTCLIFDNPADA